MTGNSIITSLAGGAFRARTGGGRHRLQHRQPRLPVGALPTATFAGAMVAGFMLYNRIEPAAARPKASRTPAPSQAAAKESLS